MSFCKGIARASDPTAISCLGMERDRSGNHHPSGRNLQFWARVPTAQQETTTMEKVKAGLRGLNALEKLTKGQIVLKQMSGNPDFPNPEPSMAELQIAVDELEDACEKALDRGHRAIVRKQLAVAVMDQYLTRLAGYANSAANDKSVFFI